MDVINDLFEIANEDYRRFNQNIVKGNSPIIGVRIPLLRKIATEIIKNKQVDEFFLEYDGIYFEEKLIKGLIIASNEDYFFKYNEDYFNELDSWCLVDTFCNSCKFIKNDLEKYWDFVKSLLDSKYEFVIRCGYVFMLYYYLNDKYIDEIIDLCLKKYNYYYVNMAIAWLLSVTYISCPDKIIHLLKNKQLSAFVHETTINKINDSFRVSDFDKRQLRELK